MRNYNNMQLEGWLNNLQNAKIEWIPPSQGARAPARAGTRQPPTATPPAPTSPISPIRPHSSLEAPPAPYRPASLEMGTLGPAEPMAGRNKFLSPDMSQGFPAQFADPFAQYAGWRLLSRHGKPLCSRTGWPGTSQPPRFPLFVRLPCLRQRQPSPGHCPTYRAAGREKSG